MYESLCFDLEVDGRTYWCQLDDFYRTDNFRKGKYAYTTLMMSLCSEKNSRNSRTYRADFAEFQEAIKNGEIVVSFDVKPAVTPNPFQIPPNHLQIIDDESNKVLFETPLEELGVCVVWKDKQFSEEKLKEAVTKLIRDNVRPNE